MSDHPRADQSHVSLMATRRWVYETPHPLRYVLLPGFFDPVQGIREHDRIDVIAFGDNPASHSLLVVDEIRQGELDKIIVSPLVEYVRKS